ncbi:90362bc5-0d07-46b3-b5a5-cb30ce7966c1 [Sclerotinia trifoliorum]|uniref:non-specific serine/threonine protein kinase n=1 Tax=Sclerotinia trifoliorum TaxID=28548 RepID=A0A8H2VNQ9_9HELO|nr:90362bc5-0d07-46b3-b5a5-cb30ce7966c1 [Sclerotinia trifoliorum]
MVQSILEMEMKIIQENPIHGELDNLRRSFGTLESLDTINNEDLNNTIVDLFLSLQTCKASRLLPSRIMSGNLMTDLAQANALIMFKKFDLNRVKPLLNAVRFNKPDQEIWEEVYNALTEYTPPLRPIASTPPLRSIVSALQQTPHTHASSVVNSSEHRADVDRLLNIELDRIHVDVPQIHETFFGSVEKLAGTSQAFFEKCKVETDPYFCEGWAGWPSDAKENDVIEWLKKFTKKLAAFAQGHRSIQTRKIIARPEKPIPSPHSIRKLDIGFMNHTLKDTVCDWSEIIIPGELKSNPDADIRSNAWTGIATYAREVFAAQDTRRFVLGFTLCGSFMRVWEFDRIGGIASEKFDINKEGLRFVSTMLGFLWMNEEEIGFDPTIKTENNQRFIEIERENRKERLIIDNLMMRSRCIAARATTCWKAHYEKDPSKPLVIKDSWQYPERDEEGELLCEATKKEVVNVCRYYHHETVRILGMEDDITGNIRKGLDITKAQSSNFPRRQSVVSRNTALIYSSDRTSMKRSSSQMNTPMPPPPSKRFRPKSSLTPSADISNEASLSNKRSTLLSPPASLSNKKSREHSNRIHRRVILSDYGKPIYSASSLKSLLIAFEGCIKGHESLYKAGLLHRDISINNLMINEDEENHSWFSFLIDLDLAIKEDRKGASGAKGRTGTRVFMAIGILQGHLHSYMHDLESFFWVLYWICIHYDGPDKEVGSTFLENWNYGTDDFLAILKAGTIANEQDFLERATDQFTPYYQPLVRCVNKLRRVVFPNNERWVNEDPDLYSKMRKILLEASENQEVPNF